jgi:hypothetical protein
MRAIVCFLSAFAAAAQPLSPAAEFDLNAKPHLFGRAIRTYFVASPNGLTFVVIGDNNVLLVSADPDGRILHSRSDLASVHAQINAALPRPDGSVWLLSSSPYPMLEPFGVGTGLGIGDASPVRPPAGRGSSETLNYNQMDLYSPAGEHLAFLRVLANVASPIAAGNDQLVLRSTGAPGFPITPQVLRFGTVADNQFKERTQVRLEPPVNGAIPVLSPNGDLLLINKASGTMVVIDPQTKAGSVIKLPKPSRIRAAASDSGYVYLLSDGAALKTDLTGQVLSTYRFQLRRGFDPSSVAVTGNSLYLADKSGHVARYCL